jgi:hypothetical protein
MKLHTKDVIHLMDDTEEFYIRPKSKTRSINTDFTSFSNRHQHIQIKHLKRSDDYNVYSDRDSQRYR